MNAAAIAETPTSDLPSNTARKRWFPGRRLLWTLVFLAVLTAIYYQWENWRSAKELATARERLIQRIGTDQNGDLLPPLVKDEENFMANPIFESWKMPTKSGQTFSTYLMRASALLPTGDFVVPKEIYDYDGNTERFDFEGHPDAETKARNLASHLAVGNALIQKLDAYTDLPDSVMKPLPKEAWQKCDGNPMNMAIPMYIKILDFQLTLGMHLRSAALVGDTAKVGQSARVMLRLSESGHHHALVGGLISKRLHDVAFDSLHAAFDQDCWNDEILNKIPSMLASYDDLSIMEDSFEREALWAYGGFVYLRNRPDYFGSSWSDMVVGPDSSNTSVFLYLWGKLGPRGWLDANASWAADTHLLILGEPGLSDWRTASARSDELRRRCTTPILFGDVPLPNPRTILAAIAVPNIGNIHSAAAENLFKRRCVIHACALEKFRLQTGHFPDSLESVRVELASHEIKNPHRKDDPIRYRRESKGYLLWSPGEDGRDDEGETIKNWVWRRR